MTSSQGGKFIFFHWSNSTVPTISVTFFSKSLKMKLFVATGLAVATANECGSCWEPDAYGTCVPQSGKVTTTCGSNSIQVQIDPCLFEGTHTYAGSDFKFNIYFIKYKKYFEIHIKMHLLVLVKEKSLPPASYRNKADCW